MMFLSYVSLNIKSYLYSEAIQTLIIYLKSSDSYFPFVKVVRPHSAKSVTQAHISFSKVCVKRSHKQLLLCFRVGLFYFTSVYFSINSYYYENSCFH